MDFEWDEEKRRSNIEKHGVDFVYSARMFRGPVVTQIDARGDYGEVRWISIGMVDDDCLVVVHTSRNERTRLISSWKGGRREERLYQAGLARRHRGDA